MIRADHHSTHRRGTVRVCHVCWGPEGCPSRSAMYPVQSRLTSAPHRPAVSTEMPNGAARTAAASSSARSQRGAAARTNLQSSRSLSDVPGYPARWCAPGRAPGIARVHRLCRIRAVAGARCWTGRAGRPRSVNRVGINTGCRCGEVGHAVEARDVVLGQRDDSRGCLSVQQHERPRDAQRRRQLSIGQAPAKQGPSLVGGQDVLG